MCGKLNIIDITKGQSIIVKSPPYYEMEYEYIVIQAGEKIIKASLKGSIKVKKTWSRENFELLVHHEIIKIVALQENPEPSITIKVD